MIHELQISTSNRDEFVEITRRVQEVVSREKVSEGYVIVYSPHTTAGITINENADPNVVRDMLMRWDEVYPWEHHQYKHFEGNSAAHLKASTVGCSQMILIDHGRLVLGTWQGIYFCEFDGPRQRTFYIKTIRTH